MPKPSCLPAHIQCPVQDANGHCVRTRRIRDEEQARFPAGHAFDGGGLQQFTRVISELTQLSSHFIADPRVRASALSFGSDQSTFTLTFTLLRVRWNTGRSGLQDRPPAAPLIDNTWRTDGECDDAQFLGPRPATHARYLFIHVRCRAARAWLRDIVLPGLHPLGRCAPTCSNHRSKERVSSCS